MVTVLIPLRLILIMTSGLLKRRNIGRTVPFILLILAFKGNSRVLLLVNNFVLPRLSTQMYRPLSCSRFISKFQVVFLIPRLTFLVAVLAFLMTFVFMAVRRRISLWSSRD